MKFKRMFKMSNVFSQDGNDIESDRTILQMPAGQIVKSCPADPSLLSEIHRFFRSSHGNAAAVFDLHKNDTATLSSDQINFTKTAPEVSFQYLDSFCLQI